MNSVNDDTIVKIPTLKRGIQIELEKEIVFTNGVDEQNYDFKCWSRSGKKKTTEFADDVNEHFEKDFNFCWNYYMKQKFIQKKEKETVLLFGSPIHGFKNYSEDDEDEDELLVQEKAALIENPIWTKKWAEKKKEEKEEKEKEKEEEKKEKEKEEKEEEMRELLYNTQHNFNRINDIRYMLKHYKHKNTECENHLLIKEMHQITLELTDQLKILKCLNIEDHIIEEDDDDAVAADPNIIFIGGENCPDL